MKGKGAEICDCSVKLWCSLVSEGKLVGMSWRLVVISRI